MIHYLDTARHFVAYAFQPYAWVPNISAALIQTGIVVLAVKVLRKRVSAFLHRLTHKLVAPHIEALKQHVTSELDKIK